MSRPVFGKGLQPNPAITGDVRHDAQLDLRIVGREKHAPGAARRRPAGYDGPRPCGSGCSAGSGPTRKAARWRRPPGGSWYAGARYRASICCGSLSAVGRLELAQRAVVEDQASAGGSRAPAPEGPIRRSTAAPFGVFDSTGRPSLSNRMCLDLFRRADVERLARLHRGRSASISAMRDRRVPRSARAACHASTSTPRRSMSDRTAHQRHLDVVVHGSPSFGRCRSSRGYRVSCSRRHTSASSAA